MCGFFFLIYLSSWDGAVDHVLAGPQGSVLNQEPWEPKQAWFFGGNFRWRKWDLFPSAASRFVLGPFLRKTCLFSQRCSRGRRLPMAGNPVRGASDVASAECRVFLPNVAAFVPGRRGDSSGHRRSPGRTERVILMRRANALTLTQMVAVRASYFR